MASTKRRSKFKTLCFAAVGLMGCMLLLEGCASVVLVAYGLLTAPESPHRHKMHDAELGWTLRPNVDYDEPYGPDTFIRSNERGHRGTRPFVAEAPGGKVRLLCSGDSMAFGSGVADHDTFIERIAAKDPRWESVNIAVGGYGIDQAYLRFRRETADLEYDVHLFCLITDDLRRMRFARMWGMDKPVLKLEGGNLTVHNTPIEEPGALWRFAHKFGSAFGRTRLGELGGKIKNRVHSDPAAGASLTVDEATEVAAEIFRRVQQHAEENDALAVIVHLPLEMDYRDDGAIHFTEQMREATKDDGVVYVDLFDELRELSRSDVRALFVQSASVGWRNHYTPNGAQFIADRLTQRLLDIPEMRDRLMPGENTASVSQ